MRLDGKVAVVTGASRGIGFAVAAAFKERFPDADVLPIGIDVTDTEEIKTMVESIVGRWGRIDVLVNNAGVTATKSILDMSDDDFTSVIDINLVGPFKVTREVARVMKDNGGGSIINTSSMVGSYGGKMQTAYSSSKFGINGLTKSCAKELGQYGIRVNAVAPGAVATDMAKEFTSDRMREFLAMMTPLGRMAEPDELAGAYVYLASDESSFTTGTIINVDGGIVM